MFDKQEFDKGRGSNTKIAEIIRKWGSGMSRRELARRLNLDYEHITWLVRVYKLDVLDTKRTARIKPKAITPAAVVALPEPKRELTPEEKIEKRRQHMHMMRSRRKQG